MSTDRVKLSVYVISGLMAGLAGLYTAARTLSGNPLIGENLAFESITAVVLGGVSLMGGRGSILGTLAGVLILGILSNMLNLLRVPSDYQYVLRGALLVLAVMLYARRGRPV
jgi:ribose/xylose/arabinose/galactoside ABC-type transport system permease subunit